MGVVAPSHPVEGLSPRTVYIPDDWLVPEKHDRAVGTVPRTSPYFTASAGYLLNEQIVHWLRRVVPYLATSPDILDWFGPH